MRLGVNIDHAATLRQARRGSQPDPALAALSAEAAGADSIVAHLREDRRHIQDADVYLLRAAIKTRLNLEMSVADEIVAVARRIKPDQATLVPERRQELTTEGGLDAAGNLSKIKETVRVLSDSGIEVSLFIAPQKRQIDAAVKTGASIIEIHTGSYADARTPRMQNSRFKEIADAARYAAKRKLTVASGHGLDYVNVSRIARIPQIEELNIGYSIICRALFVGLDRAVREMRALIKRQ